MPDAIDLLLALAADFAKVDVPTFLDSSSRRRELARVRAYVAHILWKNRYPVAEIARRMNMDRTSVDEAISRWNDTLSHSQIFKFECRQLEDALLRTGHDA